MLDLPSESEGDGVGKRKYHAAGQRPAADTAVVVGTATLRASPAKPALPMLLLAR